MRTSKTGRFHRRRVVPAVLWAAVVVLLALAPAAMANNPPAITGASVTPSSLPYTGGTVTVSATPVDTEGGGVDFVWVEVYDSYGGWSSYALNRGANPEEFVGEVPLVPNFSGEPVSYQFIVVARDLDGEEGRGGAGEVTVDAGPVFDEAPTLWDASVSPRTLTATGGAVQLGVSAYDQTGLTEVYAYITDRAGNVTQVPLEPVSGDRFEGVWNVPAATGTAGEEYHVQMVALDLVNGMGNVDAGTVTVAGVPGGGRATGLPGKGRVPDRPAKGQPSTG